MKTSIRLLLIALFFAAVIGSETLGANFRVPAEDGWYTWQVEAADGSELAVEKLREDRFPGGIGEEVVLGFDMDHAHLIRET